ncbi:MAG: hypothetical protein KF758_02625 [Anaerolineales bacterium]|nr:hypothetical protein [Anaerolineales bacterium]MBX3035783.1 hypothetical protein [Anaerolineales bacterium]
MNTNLVENLPLACVPNAVAPDKQEYWMKEIVPKLYKAVQEIRELPNGWAWRLPSNREVLVLLTEELDIGRLCCPFVNYTLEIEPNGGPFWLYSTGGEGVKEFLKMAYESANYFDAQVAKDAGFNIDTSQEIDSLETALEVTNKLNEQYAKKTISKS